jgi:cation diffusion facilitator CzcD-associated flavoprotein CzcO
MAKQQTSLESPAFEVVVIGAGLAGLGAGIELARAGIPFTILEKSDQVGGTWKVNTYPGVAVDVDAFNYSYGSVRYFEWTRAYARGAEVAAYSEHLADHFDLRRHIRFRTELVAARWDDARHEWRLELRGGEVLTCRFVLHAPGGLTQPKWPDIAGLAEYRGRIVHTATWDATVPLAGKRVAVIGTGASAVQVVPSIAPDVAHLTVFQRTPVWVAPKRDFLISPRLRALLARIPLLFRLLGFFTGWRAAVFFRAAMIYHKQLPFLRRIAERIMRAHMKRQVPDPVLRAKLTPNYGLGCKRPVISNDYLRAFNRQNVALVTEPIERVTPAGIRTASGREHAIDVLILATGFKVFERGNTPPYPVYGEGGVELGQFWHDNPYQAYQACTLPILPNCFILTAPYGLGGRSYLTMIEAGTRHALRVIQRARRRGASYAAVRASANSAYHAEIKRRMRNTVFESGACQTANSYYFDHRGEAVAMRPHMGFEIWWRSHFSNLSDYEFRALPARARAEQPARPLARAAARPT